MRSGKGQLLFYIIFMLLGLVGTLSTRAQTVVKGVVLDSHTLKPIPGAGIGTRYGLREASTDKQGHFIIKSELQQDSLFIYAMGYQHKHMLLTDSSRSWVQVTLVPTNKEIEAVDIVKKGKYNKNNPAAELIDIVIQHKKENKLARKDSLYFQQYDKVKFGMVNPKPGISKTLGDIGFFFQNVDTSLIQGKALLTMYQQEDLSDNYIKQQPSRTKKIIRFREKTEFNPKYINNPNIESYLNYLFQPVDIYDESIFYLNKLLLSPIADNAKLYYKYQVLDTVKTATDYYVRLRFEPFNMNDVLFKGELKVALDGSYAIQGADLRVDKNANINWVNDLSMRLSYFKDPTGVMLQDTVHIVVLFGRGSKDALFGERLSLSQHYNLKDSSAASVFSGAPVELRLAENQQLGNRRPVALNPNESKTYAYVDSLNQMPAFNNLLAVGYLIAQGYYSVGKFEFGPLEYLYHRNNLEGNRFRIGGRTTAEFSDRIYLQGYLAYGTDDARFKYYLKTAVALNNKAITTFPAHYLEGTIQSDIFEPGKGLGFLKGDSFFRSFRSNRPLKWLFTDSYRLGHLVEFGNHWSVATQLTHQRRRPLGDLRFPLSSDSTQFLQHIHTNDIQVALRWAPFEKFYYRNLERSTIAEKHPVFVVQYNRGIKGPMGGDYNYDAVRFSVAKRFFWNQLGFGDAIFTAGKIWGTLPYPLLEMPNVQELKDRNTISYDMTNSMEFAADQFVKFSYEHELNGYILNKIPLVKKLKLREIFGVRAFYGEISKNNNPYLSADVVYFDRNADGQTITHALNRKPYCEGYLGLDNILNVLRVQYFYRFNYNDNPNVRKQRYVVSLNFNF